CCSEDTRAYRAVWRGCITEYSFLNKVCGYLCAGTSGGVLNPGVWSCYDEAYSAWQPLSLVLTLTYERRGSAGRTPAKLCRVLSRVRHCPGGRPSDQRHDLFIGLGQPSKTQPAGFKRALNLPALRVMTFSTDHDRLLAPKAWEGHGACRAGAARREILRHSWDVTVYVGYWSRTLTAGSQLCKECTVATVGEPRAARTRRVYSLSLSNPDATELGTPWPAAPLATPGHQIRGRSGDPPQGPNRHRTLSPPDANMAARHRPGVE